MFETKLMVVCNLYSSSIYTLKLLNSNKIVRLIFPVKYTNVLFTQAAVKHFFFYYFNVFFFFFKSYSHMIFQLKFTGNLPVKTFVWKGLISLCLFVSNTKSKFLCYWLASFICSAIEHLSVKKETVTACKYLSFWTGALTAVCLN